MDHRIGPNAGWLPVLRAMQTDDKRLRITPLERRIIRHDFDGSITADRVGAIGREPGFVEIETLLYVELIAQIQRWAEVVGAEDAGPLRDQ